MKEKVSEQTNSYFIDVESVDELARLIEQDRHMNEQIGLFPLSIDTLFPLRGEHEYRVLDLACGSGVWALEVAFQMPQLEVIGVDIASSMVSYATSSARSQRRENVMFDVMDVTKILPFLEASFQYIHARFLVGFMKPDNWLPLMQECKRLLAPGGVLCLTETEWPLTNSPAYEQLTALTSLALKLAGQSLSPDGRHFGITPMLSRFLLDAGYEHIQCKTFALDWSAGTDLNMPYFFNCRHAFALLRPFLLRMGVTNEAEFDLLYNAMLNEIQLPSFCGLVAPLAIWGQQQGHVETEDDD